MAVTVYDKGINGIVHEVSAAGDVAIAIKPASSNSNTVTIKSPASGQVAVTQTYSTADATFSAYTADAESSAYAGMTSSSDGVVYAKLADLNALRTAYETLRAHAEDTGKLVNSVVDALQEIGLLG